MLLDGRAARTTMKSPILIENEVLAAATAAEWDMIVPDQEIILKRMPMVRTPRRSLIVLQTTLACVALDQVRTSRQQMERQILKYLETDTVWCCVCSASAHVLQLPCGSPRAARKAAAGALGSLGGLVRLSVWSSSRSPFESPWLW